MSRYLVLFTALAAFSCSGQSAPAPAPVGAVDTGAVATEDTAVEETPEPPEVCGNRVGDIFCNHALMGYARVGETTGLATTTEYGSFKLTDVLSKSTAKYAYVYASAYW